MSYPYTANKAHELPMTLPSECEPFLLRSGGSSNLTEHGGTKGAAAHGGHWSACTHLKSYGLNVDFGVLNMLLALQPRSSLELGSGMGLHTSWLQRWWAHLRPLASSRTRS